MKLFTRFKNRTRPCPRELAGHSCHARAVLYGYVCNECGRTGLKT